MATDQKYYWRWIPLSTFPDFPVSAGTYIFSITDVDGYTTEQSKTLTIDPIPAVDYKTVKISRDGVNWISQVDDPNGGFEQIALTGQSLWIKWDSVDNLTANPSKIYYYRVQIRNRTQTVLHNTDLLDGYGIDRVEIPIEVLNNILHDRSSYRIKIEVFDTGYLATSSNKSESGLILFTTGDLKLSDPVIDWAVVYKHTYYSGPATLQDHLQCNFSFFLPSGQPDPAKMDAINVTLPDGRVYLKKDYSYTPSNNKLSYYLTAAISPPNGYSTGKVIFQATYAGKDYFFEDFFGFPRTIIPSELIFGNNNFNSPLLVSKPITLTWNTSLSGKSYEARIEEYVPATNGWKNALYSPWITPVLEDGNTLVSYKIPEDANIKSLTTYRWQIRAYEGATFGDTDGRGSSSYKYFKVE